MPLSRSLFSIAPIYDANTGWTVSCDSSTNPVVICSLLLTQQLSDVCRRLRSSQLNPPIPFPRSSCLLNCGGLRNIRNTERLYVRWCSGTKLPCMLSECCCQYQRRVSKQKFCMTPTSARQLADRTAGLSGNSRTGRNTQKSHSSLIKLAST